MGATVSGSSPPTETLLVKIPEYSKLVRVPGPMQTLDEIFFRGLQWDVMVCAMPLEEGDLADYLVVGVWSHNLESAIGTDIFLEILDETGEHTVFQSESSRGSWEEGRGCLMLRAGRRQLEASSCVRRDDDSLTVRCTLKEQPKQRRRLLGSWSSSKSKKQHPVSEVTMAASHTLTIGSLSELKAVLLSQECAYSTRFAVGGSRWYLALYPTPAVLHLVRATKEDDETRTTAEFSFALEGAVNIESQKMRHTFDRANPYCLFAYQPPEEPSSTSTDRLVVRCCVEVSPVVVPTPVRSHAVTIPATAILNPVPPPTESVLTPLLSAIVTTHPREDRIAQGN
ncbi:hypothetical protein ACQ4PT_016787 [Festuca glaucescens]